MSQIRNTGLKVKNYKRKKGDNQGTIDKYGQKLKKRARTGSCTDILWQNEEKAGSKNENFTKLSKNHVSVELDLDSTSKWKVESKFASKFCDQQKKVRC